MIRPIIVEGTLRGRRLDPSQSRPRSLDVVGDDKRPVLRWILHALSQLECEPPIYVGGYHIEKVIDAFPGLNVRYHEGRNLEGELGALCACEWGKDAVLFVSAGTVVLPGAFEKLIGSSLARGVYNDERAVGAFFVNAGDRDAVLAVSHRLFGENRHASIDMLFDVLDNVRIVDLTGLAAPAADQAAVARTIFRGKAQTLDNLAPLVRGVTFLPRERIALQEWQFDRERVIDRVLAAFPDRMLVVRSSANAEDGLLESAAGKYRTVLGVPGNDRASLARAVDDVIASYVGEDRERHEHDEVLVQPQLQDLRASGVLLTRDPRSGAPYFVLNEDTSGLTDVVTGGGEGVVHQQFIAWPAVATAEGLSENTRRVLRFGQELIELSGVDALDVEYAIGRDGACHLLQARPLPAARRQNAINDDDTLDLISSAHSFVRNRMGPVAGLVGSSTVLGVMPDWNPAEMIGIAPRPLALSLYQFLIGSDAWADGRKRIGYRDVRPEPLIVAIGGRPYVDVRASLNSFLPASLDERTAGRWVDACLERLRAEPSFHDKIEFEIAITCLAPDWEISSRRLEQAGVDRDMFKAHLQPLTAGIVSGAVEGIDKQIGKLEILKARRDAQPPPAATNGSPAQSRAILHHLQDCRRFGLVPFSILARYGFISMSFLRGFLSTGVISEDQYQAFLRAVPTVAGTIAADLNGEVGREELLRRYGHLRPNSYEITSPNYASDPDEFLRAPLGKEQSQPEGPPEEILRPAASRIERSLQSLGLDIPFETVSHFIAASIVGREHAKFEFMKSLNAALELIAAVGSTIDFDRERMSFLPASEMLRLATDSFAYADRAALRRVSAFNEKRWALTQALRLPDVISNADEVLAFSSRTSRPNFVTRKRVVARAVRLDAVAARPELNGAIVITRAADPGYDWIFAHGIAGLVTEYGGTASHMSIRAAEFGLPAAIGCGSVLIESLRNAEVIELDCASERIRIVS